MIVALTGGIATGKTTVANLFAQHGAIVVSADDLGHKALHSTGEAYEPVKRRFNFLPDLLDEHGEINRQTLGNHVFSNPCEMQDLDAIVHPIVGRMYNKIVTEQHKENENIFVYECAVLYEYELNQTLNFSYIISTWCPHETQVKRLMERNTIERSEALQRIEMQISADNKRFWADFDVDTSVSLEALEMRAKHIYDVLVELMPINKRVKELLYDANTYRSSLKFRYTY